GTLQGKEQGTGYALSTWLECRRVLFRSVLTFSGFGTLQGGSAVDTFTLGANATFNLKGGNGLDVFALGTRTLTGSIAGEAAGGSITGLGSARSEERRVGKGGDGGGARGGVGMKEKTNRAGRGKRGGTELASSWALSATSGSYADTSTFVLTSDGCVRLLGVTGVQTCLLRANATFNLKGGNGLDVFALGTRTLTGSIAGEAAGGSITGLGSATLTQAGATTGYDGTSANVSLGFTDITNLAGTGTLQGTDLASSWALSATSGSYADTST